MAGKSEWSQGAEKGFDKVANKLSQNFEAALSNLIQGGKMYETATDETVEIIKKSNKKIKAAIDTSYFDKAGFTPQMNQIKKYFEQAGKKVEGLSSDYAKKVETASKKYLKPGSLTNMATGNQITNSIEKHLAAMGLDKASDKKITDALMRRRDLYEYLQRLMTQMEGVRPKSSKGLEKTDAFIYLLAQFKGAVSQIKDIESMLSSNKGFTDFLDERYLQVTSAQLNRLVDLLTRIENAKIDSARRSVEGLMDELEGKDRKNITFQDIDKIVAEAKKIQPQAKSVKVLNSELLKVNQTTMQNIGTMDEFLEKLQAVEERLRSYDIDGITKRRPFKSNKGMIDFVKMYAMYSDSADPKNFRKQNYTQSYLLEKFKNFPELETMYNEVLAFRRQNGSTSNTLDKKVIHSQTSTQAPIPVEQIQEVNYSLDKQIDKQKEINELTQEQVSLLKIIATATHERSNTDFYGQDDWKRAKEEIYEAYEAFKKINGGSVFNIEQLKDVNNEYIQMASNFVAICEIAEDYHEKFFKPKQIKNEVRKLYSSIVSAYNQIDDDAVTIMTGYNVFENQNKDLITKYLGGLNYSAFDVDMQPQIKQQEELIQNNVKLVESYEDVKRVIEEIDKSDYSLFDLSRRKNYESDSFKPLMQELGICDELGNKLVELNENGTTLFGSLITDKFAILIQRTDEETEHLNLLVDKIKQAKSEGVNIAQILGEFKTSRGIQYQIQEAAKGSTLYPLGNIDLIKSQNKALEITNDHIVKLIQDMVLLDKLGIKMDGGNSGNFLYDQDQGFSFIDLALKDANKEALSLFEIMRNVCTILSDSTANHSGIFNEENMQNTIQLLANIKTSFLELGYSSEEIDKNFLKLRENIQTSMIGKVNQLINPEDVIPDDVLSRFDELIKKSYQIQNNIRGLKYELNRSISGDKFKSIDDAIDKMVTETIIGRSRNAAALVPSYEAQFGKFTMMDELRECLSVSEEVFNQMVEQERSKHRLKTEVQQEIDEEQKKLDLLIQEKNVLENQIISRNFKPSLLSFAQEPSGQPTLIEGLEEASEKARLQMIEDENKKIEAVANTNEQIEGQIELVDHLDKLETKQKKYKAVRAPKLSPALPLQETKQETKEVENLAKAEKKASDEAISLSKNIAKLFNMRTDSVGFKKLVIDIDEYLAQIENKAQDISGIISSIFVRDLAPNNSVLKTIMPAQAQQWNDFRKYLKETAIRMTPDIQGEFVDTWKDAVKYFKFDVNGSDATDLVGDLIKKFGMSFNPNEVNTNSNASIVKYLYDYSQSLLPSVADYYQAFKDQGFENEISKILMSSKGVQVPVTFVVDQAQAKKNIEEGIKNSTPTTPPTIPVIITPGGDGWDKIKDVYGTDKNGIKDSDPFSTTKEISRTYADQVEKTIKTFTAIRDEDGQLTGEMKLDTVQIVQDFKKRADAIASESKKIELANNTIKKFMSAFDSKTAGQGSQLTGYNDLKMFTVIDLDGIQKAQNMMTLLDAEYNKVAANFRKGSSSLDPFVNAINSAQKMDFAIRNLEIDFILMDKTSKELGDAIDEVFKLKQKFDNSKGIYQTSENFGNLRVALNTAREIMKTEKKLNAVQVKDTRKKTLLTNVENDFITLSKFEESLKESGKYTDEVAQKINNLYQMLINVSNTADRGLFSAQFKLLKNEISSIPTDFEIAWNKTLSKINAGQGKEFDKIFGTNNIKGFIEKQTGVSRQWASKSDVLKGSIKGQEWTGALADKFKKEQEANDKIVEQYETMLSKMKELSEARKKLQDLEKEARKNSDYSIDYTESIQKQKDKISELYGELQQFATSDFLNINQKVLGNERINQFTEAFDKMEEAEQKIANDNTIVAEKEAVDNLTRAYKELESAYSKLSTDANGKRSLSVIEDYRQVQKAKESLETYKQEADVAGVSVDKLTKLEKDFMTSIGNDAAAKGIKTLDGYIEKINQLEQALIKNNSLSGDGAAELAKLKLELESIGAHQDFKSFEDIEKFLGIIHQKGTEIQPLIEQIKRVNEIGNIKLQVNELDFLPVKTEKVTNVIKNLRSEIAKLEDLRSNGSAKPELIREQEVKIIQEANKAFKELTTTKSKFQDVDGYEGKVFDEKSLGLALEDYARKVLGATKEIGKMSVSNGEATKTFKTMDGQIVKVTGSINHMTSGLKATHQMTEGAVGLMGSFKSVLQQVGKYFAFYFTGFSMVTRVFSQFRKGLDVLKEFDDSLITISYTMDITRQQLDRIGDSAVNTAQKLSSSLKDTMDVYKIYANMNTTAQDLEKLATPTLILSNLSGVDAETAADQIQAVVQQFDYAAEQSDHIVDVYDKISANIAVDYSKKLELILEII